ncbi:MAG: hypothetical protein EBZ36_15355, partial [Acidobacteria bacterium]|nr:hypothetical protein [Acidobacteriota bacterium]
KRVYLTPEGFKFPSVTTVISNNKEKKAGIARWRERVGEEKANNISARSTNRGTKYHSIVEDYFNNNLDLKKYFDLCDEKIGFLQNAVGAILSPFDSFLVTRGIKTLAVRMRQHDENGRQVAAFLAEHPRIRQVHYPGLASHPRHERARRLLDGFGGMIAFDTGSLAAARVVLDNVKLCALAESLGGVETLISHPATMTHASVPEAQRVRLGITDGLVRISVGIEDVEDIIADLDQALQLL